MADYDWQAIARACKGWKLWSERGSLQRPFPAPNGQTFWSSVDLEHNPTDALAALEATGREVDLHRTVGEPGNYRWWCSIHLVDEAGRPKGTVSGSGGCCEAICRALEAYGKALMGKEEDDG